MRVLLTFLLAIGLYGLPSLEAQALFVPNQGQWHGDFSSKLELKQGAVFFKSGGYKIVLFEGENHQHSDPHNHHSHQIDKRALAFEAKFVGAKSNNNWHGQGEMLYPRNYFLGNDENYWVSNVGSYTENHLTNLLPGIDLHFKEEAELLKYDIKLDAGSHPRDLKIIYEGLESISIKEGALYLQTAFGAVVERIPLSYQLINGRRKTVEVNYMLDGDTIKFEVKGYREGFPLIIDPVLEFATFSGSGDLNFGNSATYGENGTMYGAGVNFGSNYPTTNGVFQASFAGDSVFNVDVSISKFSADGKSLLYATYLGGRDIEVVHSLISDDVGNLILIGNTGSSDFPTSADCYQSTFGGGSFQSSFAFNDYNRGTDIFISKISANGSTLLASTFWGGSANDGFNKDIYENYGDHYRGEVVLSSDGSIVVLSNTFSMDVPLTGANAQDRNQNSQDALLGVFSPDLKQLHWGRYFGGLGSETGYSAKVQFDKIFICGTTESLDLPTTVGAHAENSIGENDGYVASFELGTGNLLNCTRYGTNLNDQAFMLDLDYRGDVYIVGQTKGTLNVSPNVYSAPGSRQFLAKLDSSLSIVHWQTLVGSGQNKQDLVPSAFMVDQCMNIYFSGWNGISNSVGFPATQNGNTYGLPVTSDAYQNSTDGSDFYFMILDHNASGLLYGSYLGGQDNEHVDGGTSRFNKQGTIYQAVCSNCNNKSFPTTPGAYSVNAGTPGCNMAVFKFDFDQILAADAKISFTTSVDSLCDGLIVNLLNNSSNATNYKWLFGNGDSSTAENPTVTYQDLGSYTIQLIAYDTTCQITDTAFIEVEHGSARKPIPNFLIKHTACDQGLEAQFQNLSIIADTYEWNFGDGNSSTSPNPIHKFPAFGSYEVELIAFDTICMRSDTTYQTVSFIDSSTAPTVAANISSCSNGEVEFLLEGDRGALVYEWETEGNLFTGREPGIRFTNPGSKQITLRVTDTLCGKTFTEILNVDVDQVRNEVFAPNAFTPNGDGMNDQFQIFGDPCFTGARLQIFNRWGAKVYETDQPYDKFWDGSYQGSPAPGGSYTYILLEQDQKITGIVNLIR